MYYNINDLQKLGTKKMIEFLMKNDDYVLDNSSISGDFDKTISHCEKRMKKGYSNFQIGIKRNIDEIELIGRLKENGKTIDYSYLKLYRLNQRKWWSDSILTNDENAYKIAKHKDKYRNNLQDDYGIFKEIVVNSKMKEYFRKVIESQRDITLKKDFQVTCTLEKRYSFYKEKFILMNKRYVLRYEYRKQKDVCFIYTYDWNTIKEK